MSKVKKKLSLLLLALTAIMLLGLPTGASTSVQAGARRHAIENSLHARMMRFEPQFVSMADKLEHHVKSSQSRAATLRARVKLSGEAGSGYNSTVTEIPGGYAMSISLGSPPQTFQAIVDTGSDLTWVQSARCSECFNQVSKPFDDRKSSSFGVLPCSGDMCAALYGGFQSPCPDNDTGHANCQYIYRYGDNSATQGNLCTETVTLDTIDGGKLAVPNFAFGVGVNNSVDFSGVDGLVGLGQGPVSFPSQLGEKYGNVFSYCLQSIYSPVRSSPIFFGQSALPRSEDVQYTSLQTSANDLYPTYWFLNLLGVSVNDKDVVGHRGFSPSRPRHPSPHKEEESLGTIIDSGTTLTMLDTHTYECLKSSLERKVQYTRASSPVPGIDLCYDVKDDPYPDLPSLSFNFPDAVWVIPKENSYLPVDDAHRIYCLAMIPSNQGIQIIGNLQQQGFQVIYDQANSRVGWVPAECGEL